jgi:hypothetical protein
MKNAMITRWFGLIVLLTMAVGCGTGPASTPTAPPVVPTNTPQPTQVPPTETPAPTNTPLPTPTKGPIIIDDDFSTDTGRFKCETCIVEGGELTMGPFAMVDSYKPFVALCNDCGSIKNYKMSVDTWYNSGNSQFGWGLVVRQDEKTTYLLAASSWLVYNVFSFDLNTASSGGRGYRTLIGNWSKGGLVAGRGINHFEVVMEDSSMAISINGMLIRNLDLKASSGQVGLWVGNWETSALFDNFHFEELP